MRKVVVSGSFAGCWVRIELSTEARGIFREKESGCS